MNNKVILKPIRGTKQFHLFTRKITKEHLISDTSLQLCPAIYQEYIQGSNHIRAHVFGDKVYAVLLTSNDLDWRENLDIPFEIIELSHDN